MVTRFNVLPSRLVLLASALFINACQHHTPKLEPIPASEEHCWWAVMRSLLPLDTVATRFERAFNSLGVTPVTSKRIADSVWVNAGRGTVTQIGPGIYASRVVGYWDGNSTHFRQFVTFIPAGSDAVNAGARTIAFCSASARAADVQAIVPREPTGEEGLTLWTRVP